MRTTARPNCISKGICCVPVLGSHAHRQAARSLLPRLEPSHAAASDAQTSTELLEFVRSKGGILHPSLAIQSPKPGVLKGLKSIAPIPSDAVLFQLPVTLRITADSARSALETMICTVGGADAMEGECHLDELDDLQVLGLWLAAERAKGPASSWRRYLDALPEHATCGWAKTEEEVSSDWRASLYRLGMDLEWWQYFLGQARVEMEGSTARLVKAYGAFLAAPGAPPLEVSDVMWGVGHAMSRKFEVEGQVFLEPLSDVLNLNAPSDLYCVKWAYARSSSAKEAIGDEDGGIVVSRAMFKTECDGLAVGQEIFNSHGFEDMTVQGRLTPLTMYLLHGYVPMDVLDSVRMRAITSALLPFTATDARGGAGAGPEESDEVDAVSALEDPEGLEAKTGVAQYASPADVPVTQLYDYLTPQYQQDVTEVLDIVFMSLIQKEQAGGMGAYSQQPKEVQRLLLLLREVPHPLGSAKLPELIEMLDASVIELIDLAESM